MEGAVEAEIRTPVPEIRVMIPSALRALCSGAGRSRSTDVCLDRLYMQNHGGFEDPTLGVLRSDDAGQSWKSIAKGLPPINCVKAAVV